VSSFFSPLLLNKINTLTTCTQNWPLKPSTKDLSEKKTGGKYNSDCIRIIKTQINERGGAIGESAFDIYSGNSRLLSWILIFQLMVEVVGVNG